MPRKCYHCKKYMRNDEEFAVLIVEFKKNVNVHIVCGYNLMKKRKKSLDRTLKEYVKIHQEELTIEEL